jgi:hypothetical protein
MKIREMCCSINVYVWRYDNQHHDTQRNNIQQDDTQHKGLHVTLSIYNTQHK